MSTTILIDYRPTHSNKLDLAIQLLMKPFSYTEVQTLGALWRARVTVPLIDGLGLVLAGLLVLPAPAESDAG